MNILLISMPDSFEHMPTVGIRMPNGALSSLAGNLDPHHRVAVADLILAQGEVRTTVERLVRERSPDLVGLSVMTFQRRTALDIIQLIRALRPGVRIVAGGYDPSLAPEAYTEPDSGVVWRFSLRRRAVTMMSPWPCVGTSACSVEGPGSAGGACAIATSHHTKANTDMPVSRTLVFIENPPSLCLCALRRTPLHGTYRSLTQH